MPNECTHQENELLKPGRKFTIAEAKAIVNHIGVTHTAAERSFANAFADALNTEGNSYSGVTARPGLGSTQIAQSALKPLK